MKYKNNKNLFTTINIYFRLKIFNILRGPDFFVFGTSVRSSFKFLIKFLIYVF